MAGERLGFLNVPVSQRVIREVVVADFAFGIDRQLIIEKGGRIMPISRLQKRSNGQNTLTGSSQFVKSAVQTRQNAAAVPRRMIPTINQSLVPPL